ncbi:hypothetical protein CF327_g6656 [Tilletia walkeri]|nr:hypothetical protein CF327_g6656 [Tilletia walkeri]
MPSSPSFIRPSFSLPIGTDAFPQPTAHIRTIYDVLAQTASANPDHTYALQFTDRTLDIRKAISVSHAQLLRAIDRCSAWLVHNGFAQRSVAVPSNDGLPQRKTNRGKPIAVFLGSDLNIFIHVVALLKLGNPVAIFSSRLSGAALEHLVQAITVDRILTTPAQWRTIQDEVSPTLSAATVPVRPLVDFLLPSTELDSLPIPEKGDEPDHNDRTVFAWHSSGSTGLPKPVFHTHRFWHCYLACHQFSEDEDVHRKVALNMPPLYHGFGMLPMALAISVGFTVVLPPPSTIPTPQLILNLLRVSHANLLFTVPSLLTDMILSSDEQQSSMRQEALDALRALDVVAFAGAPFKPSTADTLAQAGVLLLNHFGATETGSLAPIRFPPPGYQWRHLLLRDDMGLEFAPMPGVEDPSLGYLQLSSRPFGWEEKFFLSDALLAHQVPHQHGDGTVTMRTEYSIAGRVDNVIVLATGEKVSPNLLEDALSDLPEVDEAILFGNGRFQIGALVELSSSYTPPSTPLDKGDASSSDCWERTKTHILAKLWPALASANAQVDSHAKLERGLIILTSKSRKSFVRTAKGTAARGATLKLFEGEIAKAYEELEVERVQGEGGSSLPLEGEVDTLAEWEKRVRALVSSCLLSPHHEATASSGGAASKAQERVIGNDADFFEELGMDSLKAVRLLRLLSAGLRERESAGLKADGESGEGKRSNSTLPQDFIYRYCTVTALATALRRHLSLPADGGEAESKESGEYGVGMDEQSIAERSAAIEKLVEEVEGEMKSWAMEEIETDRVAPEVMESEGEAEGATVLLTGSTGGLGAWLVHSFLQQPITEVSRVICLVRASTGDQGQGRMSPLERQLASLRSKGVPDLTTQQRSRLQVLGISDLSAPYFGLRPEMYKTHLSSVTHVVHNAWSVDFLRPLHSFKSQVRATARLLHLAGEVGLAQGKKVRFVFSSSIAVVGRSYAVGGGAEAGSMEPIREEELEDAARTVPMGYALAKLACEKLVSRASLNSHPPTLIEGTSIRIGQLTGAEGHGNWSPSEHMALILQSSAYIGSLPRLSGTLSWFPTNRAARAYVELVLVDSTKLPRVMHLENPGRTRWEDVMGVFAEELGRPKEQNGLAPFSLAKSRRGSEVLEKMVGDGGEVSLADCNGSANDDEPRKRQRTSEAPLVLEGKTDLVVPETMTPQDSNDDEGLPPRNEQGGSEPADKGRQHSGRTQERKEDYFFAGSHAAHALDSSALTPPDTPGNPQSNPKSTTSGSVPSLSVQGFPTSSSSASIPIVDFPTWLEAVRNVDVDDGEGAKNPARKLLSFLEGDFVPIATGRVVLDMALARGLSDELKARVDAVGERHVREYVSYWRRMGLLL